MNRGIVICAGGSTYFTNAFVCIKILRHLGCILPIALWYADESEYHPTMSLCLQNDNVSFIDASKVPFVAQQFGRSIHPWAMKPIAVQQSVFDEVLLLDADIVPVRDPTFLFQSFPFTEWGAIFWPDCIWYAENDPIWKIFGVTPNEWEWGFQGGQQMINKIKCKEALRIAVNLNLDADIFYHLVYGEQDLYRMAWKMTETSYCLVEGECDSWSIPGTLLAHDLQGRPLFQHRCGDKWNLLPNKNKRLAGFQHEALCFDFLDELRSWFPKWSIAPQQEFAA